MPSPAYTWNTRASRYVDSRGRFVSRNSVSRAIEQATEAARKRGRALSQELRSGSITLVEWEQGMRKVIKDVHLYSAAAARGGWAQLTSEDFGYVGPTVRFHYGKLHSFAQELEAGLPMDGRFLQRTELYVLGGRQTYWQQDGRQMEAAGMNEERNVLHPADHCGGCLDASERGWVPIGTLPRPGTRQCLSRCRCRLRYR